MALNAAAPDARIKATAAATMYDMTHANARGYFDSADNKEARYQAHVRRNRSTITQSMKRPTQNQRRPC